MKPGSFATGSYAAAVLALAVAAMSIAGLRCEGFGCLGVGIAWMAWAAAFALMLLGGLLLQPRLVPGSAVALLGRGVLILQLVMGLAAVVSWISNHSG
jgi:hypothetical protein